MLDRQMLDADSDHDSRRLITSIEVCMVCVSHVCVTVRVLIVKVTTAMQMGDISMRYTITISGPRLHDFFG